MGVHPVFIAVVALGILAPCLGSRVKLKVCSSCAVANGYYSHDFSCRNLFCMAAVYVFKLCPCRIIVCILPTTEDGIEVVFGYHFLSSNRNCMILRTDVNFQSDRSCERALKGLRLSARHVLLWFNYLQIRSTNSCSTLVSPPPHPPNPIPCYSHT